mgnify:CR=1 FL=1
MNSDVKMFEMESSHDIKTIELDEYGMDLAWLDGSIRTLSEYRYTEGIHAAISLELKDKENIRASLVVPTSSKIELGAIRKITDDEVMAKAKYAIGDKSKPDTAYRAMKSACLTDEEMVQMCTVMGIDPDQLFQCRETVFKIDQ